jgi:NADH-quinone oxidoreductase subunit J
VSDEALSDLKALEQRAAERLERGEDERPALKRTEEASK